MSSGWKQSRRGRLITCWSQKFRLEISEATLSFTLEEGTISRKRKGLVTWVTRRFGMTVDCGTIYGKLMNLTVSRILNLICRNTFYWGIKLLDVSFEEL